MNVCIYYIYWTHNKVLFAILKPVASTSTAFVSMIMTISARDIKFLPREVKKICHIYLPVWQSCEIHNDDKFRIVYLNLKVWMPSLRFSPWLSNKVKVWSSILDHNNVNSIRHNKFA